MLTDLDGLLYVEILEIFIFKLRWESAAACIHQVSNAN